MYAEFSKGKMQQEELKARFSWEILMMVIRLGHNLRVNAARMNIETDSMARAMISAQIDSSIRERLNFLMKKYPSKNKIVDLTLSQAIKDKELHREMHYDILRNAGMSFVDDTGRTDFSCEIKVWLNKLILEVRRTLPAFRNAMKTLFTGSDKSSVDGSAVNEEVVYEIGAKIH